MKNPSLFFYLAFARIPTEKAHGIQIVNTCEALIKENVSVVLVVPKRINTITQDIKEYYGLERDITIKYIPIIDCVGLGIIGYILSLVMFTVGSTIYSMYHKPAVIYSRDRLPLSGSLLVRSRHFYESHRNEWGIATRFLFPKCVGILCITNGLKEFYQSKHISPSKLYVVPDAVDLKKFESVADVVRCRTELGFPLDKKIIMYVGSFSLYSWKGADVFLESARLLPHMLFAGIGATKEEIEKINHAYRDPQNIVLIEKKQNSVIPRYIQSADVLILPNKSGDVVSEKYTSPMKMFEYMASGKPIVASDLPSIREVLKPECAVLVEPDNAHAVAIGIEIALGEKGVLIAQNALDRVQSYTWQKRALHIIEITLCAE